MPRKTKKIEDVQTKLFRLDSHPEDLGYLSAEQVRERISEWISEHKELPLPNGAVVFFDAGCEDRNVPVSVAVSELLGGHGVSVTGTAIMVPPPL